MRFRALLSIALLARLGAAQTPDTMLRATPATVRGLVLDSIARKPLAGATVQLVAAENPARFGRMAVSDSLGWFTFGDVPDGRYLLGFFHPMLDSLGLEPTLRDVVVDSQRPVRIDLAIPSPTRLRAAICGTPDADDFGAVVVGVVFDAHQRAPAAGVTVTGEWLEIAFKPEGLIRRVPRLTATTHENGWYALCGVPRPGTIALTASRGADSTDRIEVLVSPEGFVRRELYLGLAHPMLVGDSLRPVDPLAATLHPVGRLNGTVTAADGGRPLNGAQVSIANGPQTHANERGDWTLVDAPVGTRMLEVRAIGYYPERRRVDVVAGALPIHSVLSTLKAVLDTLKITASRLRDFSGFEQRRRSGTGQYLTAKDIARRNPRLTSDIFRMIPGVHMMEDSVPGKRSLLVRGNTREWCSPSIYFNGQYLSGISADDIDDWVHPEEVAGIEIYAGAGAPANYQQGLARPGGDEGGIACGTILIWSKSG